MMKPSEKFFEITGKTGLYNIQAIENVSSIVGNGLLSYEHARKIKHVSIAINEVQKRRNHVAIPNGLKLHQYANLYFDYWNPMLSSKRNQNNEICILKFNRTVLDIEGVIISDRNASSSYVAFYDVDEGIENIDFSMIYAKYWNEGDFYEKFKRKSAKCAEILVPHHIPYSFVMRAAVTSNDAAKKLLNAGFDKEIIVDPSLFF